ncbi:trans-sialidase, putative [Trypanosoma cruzi marinkellei]|uniref:Trans-sialidase, putative n=1 Tax=Trypanosoma cruzi marinkellei TaxID=85056 RepID=K2MIP2_TRYCR|nr:trans-sialidase, putative [Trypanosoma cruzi marinkellei]
MGLKRIGNKTLLGLSYDNNMGWIVMPGPYPNYETKWEPNQTYHVVLKMHDGVGSVYVDGKHLSTLGLPRSSDELRDAASHFYFGACDEQLSSGKVHATVTNVFLYNRPLNDTEIGNLNANKVAITPPKKLQAPASTAASPSVKPATAPAATVAQATVPAPTSAAPQPTTQVTSNGSGDASDGGASVPAGSATTTPTAGEETVNQLASGTSPGAASTEGGVSSGENGDTAGGTDGQGEIRSPDGEARAAALRLALSSKLGNPSQGDNSVAGTVSGSRVLPLLLLLGLWGFAAL